MLPLARSSIADIKLAYTHALSTLDACSLWYRQLPNRSAIVLPIVGCAVALMTFKYKLDIAAWGTAMALALTGRHREDAAEPMSTDFGRRRAGHDENRRAAEHFGSDAPGKAHVEGSARRRSICERRHTQPQRTRSLRGVPVGGVHFALPACAVSIRTRGPRVGRAARGASSRPDFVAPSIESHHAVRRARHRGWRCG